MLVIILDRDGIPSMTAYNRTRKRAAGGESHATPLPLALYDQRMVHDLSRVRTTALQSALAGNVSLAHAVLLDALLPIALGYPASAHAVQLRAATAILPPTPTFEVNAVEMATAFDGVADLIAAMPGTGEERLKWVLSLDANTVARMLAACTGALLDATHGKYAEPSRLQSADCIARAVNLDMRQHWVGGIGFYDRMTRKAMLAALTEARSPEVAMNCERLKKPDLAEACVERLAGTDWLPPALRTQAAPEASEDLTDEAEMEFLAA